MGGRGRVSAILHLGLPIVIAQLGTIMQSFADTIMVGQYGTPELSSAGLVNNLMNLVLFFVLGLSYSTTPVVGALWGQGKKEEAKQALNNSLVVGISGRAVIVALLVLLYFNLEILDQPEELMPLIRPYYIVILLSIPFVGVFNSFKQYSDAIGDTRTPMWVMLISNVVNIIGNYFLIFTFDLGLLGAGISTLLSRILMAAWLWLKIGAGRNHDKAGIIHLTKKALPISVQLCLEAGSFNVCALFMGWIGATALAAHQVMCVVGCLCFMVYYGMGAAAAIRISHYRGLGDFEEVKKTAYTALLMTLCFGAVIAMSVYFTRNFIFDIFTTDRNVVELLICLLPAFFAYQIGDCVQTIIANCLRAIEDVKAMMLFAFIAYVVISIPSAYIFAFPLGMGAVGVWWSFPLGLTSAGIMYYIRFKMQISKMINQSHAVKD